MKMKKYLSLTVLIATLFAFSPANADLIGVSALASYPRIFFNGTGEVTYTDTGTTGTFELDASDIWIQLNSASAPIFFIPAVVPLAISLTVDGSGNIVGPGTMTETVAPGSETVTIAGNTYGPGDVLLSASIVDFGFINDAGTAARFDFLLGIMGGLLVSDGIWPAAAGSGITAGTFFGDGGWDGNFDGSFSMSNINGLKAAAPEPGSMFLLGSGLSALGIYLRRRRNKA